jgi:hypothetical protein
MGDVSGDDMDERDLQRWVDHWSSEYQPEWDFKIEGLAGKDAFSHLDVERVYEWKFRRMWPKRKIDRMKEFSEKRVLDLSRRAFLCADELGALMILTLVPGAAAAGASALLTAHDPARYTVMDGRAILSLTALKRWSEEQGTRASCLWWTDYLATCRDIAARTDRPLRSVDRALWTARGRLDLSPP